MNSTRKIDWIYMLLVNKVPGIRERYKRRRNSTKGVGRIGAWLYLFWLNLIYHVFRYKKLNVLEKYPYYEAKHLYSKGSESSLSKRESPEMLARRLEQYDVVSFDVFDTLILRPFSEPADLFYILGEELGYMDFRRIRIEMELRAREEKYEKENHYEVNLSEIYDLFSREAGIDKKIAMKREIEMEKTYCFANPYMRRVVEILRNSHKRIIITSDMYLNAEQIKALLESCGYEQFDAYYVSCDVGKSKSEGSLYKEVKKQEEYRWNKNTIENQINRQDLESKKLSFIHIGDNYIADIENAQKQGLDTVHYVNVNVAGAQYRAEDMSVIIGSIYRGIVNTHIHNGLYEYTREYEYGFIYGGLFVTGYCQFIHEYRKTHQIDKILFLARDGYILMKAYEKLYPNEAESVQYVYWSRLAAVKMAAEYFKYDYFRRFLYHKVNQEYTLEEIMKSMELDDMLKTLCTECQLLPQTNLTEKNVDKVKQFLLKNWDYVLEHYKEQLKAGKQYFEEILKCCNKVVAVDIGWAGSGALSLDYIVNKLWKMNCKIIGIIAGTNTCHNTEPDVGEAFLQMEKLVSYLYSQRENRDLWKFHDPGKGHNLYWEMLLDAPHGSLKGFYFDEKGEWKCELKKESRNKREIEDIQKGILDFVTLYDKVQKKENKIFKIGGRDAYAPLLNVENDVNRQFMKEMESLMDSTNIE